MLAQFAQPIGIGAVRRSDDQDDIDQLGQRLHGILPVLRGVTDVFLMRALDVRKPLMQAPPRYRGIHPRSASFASHRTEFGVFPTCSFSTSSTEETK